MTDRDRLINIVDEYTESLSANDLHSLDFADRFADHLLTNGVIVPPVSVGDIVYSKYSGTNEIEYYVIDEVTYLGSDFFQFEAHLENEDGYTVDIIEFGVPEIGKTVFLTKEEAEKKLKELG